LSVSKRFLPLPEPDRPDQRFKNRLSFNRLAAFPHQIAVKISDGGPIIRE
jgi:hypothetical protein